MKGDTILTISECFREALERVNTIIRKSKRKEKYHRRYARHANTYTPVSSKKGRVQ